jgi:hypothetical protein
MPIAVIKKAIGKLPPLELPPKARPVKVNRRLDPRVHVFPGWDWIDPEKNLDSPIEKGDAYVYLGVDRRSRLSFGDPSLSDDISGYWGRPMKTLVYRHTQDWQLYRRKPGPRVNAVASIPLPLP